MTSRPVRTRFAPSPTGPLHIGGVRTALYSYLYAKRHGGQFLLRIEDTDTARTVAGSEDIINQSLEWCGIIPDEGVLQGGEYGPYRQSERKAIYQQHAEMLISKGKAYLAFDTEAEIAAWRAQTAETNGGISENYNYISRLKMKNSLTLSEKEVSEMINKGVPYVVRLKVEAEDDVTFEDLVRGQVTFEASQLDDRVLLKSDGMPTYHLANVVDDYLMKITHVIRGEEWLASTPHHILLYRAFGWEMPKFAHLPLMLKPSGKGKLSKRDGDALGFPVFAVQWQNPETQEVFDGYRERGFLPEAFVNFIALLGWNDGTDKELFGLNELIESFDLNRIHKSGAKFNYEKALWFNQQYLRNLSTETLVNALDQQVDSGMTETQKEYYVSLFRDRITFVHELAEIGSYIYSPITIFDHATYAQKWKTETDQTLRQYVEILKEIDWTASALESKFKDVLASNNQKMGDVMPILRILLTGIMKGPSVFDTMTLIGRETSIQRLSNRL